jgi:hypothetical protein
MVSNTFRKRSYSTLVRAFSSIVWSVEGTEADGSSVPPSCANAATLMMAIPSGLSGLNPILAVNLPLSLSAPRGENKAVDALRLSLLGVGAIHQAFLFAKNQNGLNQTSSLLSRARTLREAARDMLLAASQDAEMAKHDAAIAAGATNALIDVSKPPVLCAAVDVDLCPQIFFGGVRWEENFKLVKDLIHRYVSFASVTCVIHADPQRQTGWSGCDGQRVQIQNHRRGWHYSDFPTPA